MSRRRNEARYRGNSVGHSRAAEPVDRAPKLELLATPRGVMKVRVDTTGLSWGARAGATAAPRASGRRRSPLERYLPHHPRVAGATAILAALLVLLGWWTNQPLLTSFQEGWPPQQPNTAL